MKLHIVSIAALIAAFSSAINASTTVSINVLSQYASGNGAVFYTKPVVQTLALCNMPHGFYGSVWWSVGLDDGDLSSNYADEIDWTLGWSGPIGDGFGLDVSFAYWDIVDLMSDSPADVLGVTLSLSRQFTQSLGGSLTIDRYIPTDSSVFNGGHRVTLGTSYSMKISENAVLSVSPALVWEDGIFGLDDGWNGKLAASVGWNIGKMKVSFPQATFLAPISAFRDDRKAVAIFGGGVSIML